MQVLSIGEVLWDVFPDAEFLGGAPLNFSANISRLGNPATLITAIGQDERGRRAQEGMAALGVGTEFVQVVHDVATGIALVTTDAEGQPHFRILKPAAFESVTLSIETFARAKALQPDWLYFGTLLHMEPKAEEMTRKLAQSLPEVRCFYDLNLRTGHWDLSLVQRLCAIATILKLNEFEAQTLGALTGMGLETFSLEHFCNDWCTRYQIESICITLGPAGCFVYDKGSVHTVPGFPTTVEDTVGAGDAFAAAFLHGYHRRWPALQTARFANALGSIVASRAGATPAWSLEECFQLASISTEQASVGQQ